MADSMLTPPRDGIDVGDYSLRDFAAKWLMQQSDLAELGKYRDANAAVIARNDSRNRIVFIGDSITELWSGLAELGNAMTLMLNRGISGQNSTQMLLRFEDDAIALAPALIVLLCGTNDFRCYVGEPASVGASARRMIMRNVTAMADIALARSIPVVLCAIPPVNPSRPVYRDPHSIVGANEWLAGFAAQRRLGFVDYHAALADAAGILDAACSQDGVHPNECGYARMRAVLAPALAPYGCGVS
jgi:acyl-CoA thioesterase-1